MLASGDRSGLRQSHAPQWAKEVARLNRRLKRKESIPNPVPDSHELEEEINGETRSSDIGGSGIQCGKLWVLRLLTESEEDKLDEF